MIKIQLIVPLFQM